MPQLQQCQIRAESSTFTTGHSNARSLAHLARPVIKPVSSWILVRFVSTEPRQDLLKWVIFFFFFFFLVNLMNCGNCTQSSFSVSIIPQITLTFIGSQFPMLRPNPRLPLICCLSLLSCLHLLFFTFFHFWPPCCMRSSQARDQIQAEVTTQATAADL